MPESQDIYQPQPFNPALEYRPEEHLFLDPALTQSTFDTLAQSWGRRQSYDVPESQYCASDNSDASAESMWGGGVVGWGDTQRKSVPLQPYPAFTQTPIAPLYARTPNVSSPTQAMSPREPNAKRDASTAASARFRQKKKQRERSLERNVKEKQQKIEIMEGRIKELEGENGFLKELVMGRIKWKEEKAEGEEAEGGAERKDGCE
ncbi:regulatory Cys-3 protein [Rutstroemia sp. NJR-2017a BBW]|nr:regulatory Cys-3 protein [Rutstroemia sp. NJR-2017a BBW]